MKSIRKHKWLYRGGAAILLLLLAGAAISVEPGNLMRSGTHGLYLGWQRFLDHWHGSNILIALASLCFVLAIVGRGIDRH